MNNNSIFDEEVPFEYELVGEDEDIFDPENVPFEYELAEDEEEDPSFLKRAARETGRFAARGAARIGETVAGLPGDIYQFTKWLGSRDTRGKDVPKGYVETMFGALPTSQQVREKVTQPLTGEYLEPHGPLEEWSDEAISDFASLAIPVKGKIPFARALGTALFSNVSKEAAKSLGVGEKGQAATKIGSMFISGLVGRKSASKYASELFENALEEIPENVTVSGKKALSKLQTLKKELRKGGTSPQKQPTQRLIADFESMIKSNRGTIPVEELPAFRTTINDYRFDKTLSPRAHKFLNKFDETLMDTLGDYGKENPLFLQKYNDARQSLAAIKQTDKLAAPILKHLDPKNLTPTKIAVLSLVFGVQGFLAKTAAAVPAAMGVKVLKRFSSNPTLRKYYINTIGQALKGSSAGTAKSISKLSKAMDDENWEDLGFEED